jgi:hypothetical protein
MRLQLEQGCLRRRLGGIEHGNGNGGGWLRDRSRVGRGVAGWSRDRGLGHGIRRLGRNSERTYYYPSLHEGWSNITDGGWMP